MVGTIGMATCKDGHTTKLSVQMCNALSATFYQAKAKSNQGSKSFTTNEERSAI